ncbi:MAG: archaetidylserine decarboxylase [Polyangiaceae bacterium]
MIALHRTRAFLRSYAFLPHRLLNRGVSRLTAATRPGWAVHRAIRHWVRRDGIDLGDFEARRYESVDDFFLRRLRPGARPLGPGFVAPADGNLVSLGSLEPSQPLRVKGQELSPSRVVNGKLHQLSLDRYAGGAHAVIFLTPRGYHHVHAPMDAELIDVRWIPGRYFPQNADALRHIPRVYERNERATLRFRDGRGHEFLLVMVGASLIGGIHLDGLEGSQWMRREPFRVGRKFARGERIGHFAFGSTVVVLLPPELRPRGGERPEVRMGETLFELEASVEATVSR